MNDTKKQASGMQECRAGTKQDSRKQTTEMLAFNNVRKQYPINRKGTEQARKLGNQLEHCCRQAKQEC